LIQLVLNNVGVQKSPILTKIKTLCEMPLLGTILPLDAQAADADEPVSIALLVTHSRHALADRATARQAAS
jgi:hypothetical protein